MSKKISPSNNRSNQQNANRGSSGQNRQHSQVHGNRGAQKKPNKK